MNNVANAAEMTVAEVQAKHMESIKSQKVEMVPAHELFGFQQPMAGVGKLPVPVDAHPLTPVCDSDFVFPEGLVRRFLLSMQSRESIMLVGDKGTGKSSLVAQVHNRLNKPLLGINGSSGVDETHLLGSKTIEGGDVKSFDGVLSYAYRHGLSFLLDEVCTLRPGVLVGINDFLQGDSVVTLKHHGINPELDPRHLLSLGSGINIVKHPMFRLFATDNTGGKQSRDLRFAGTNGQNAAVRSRFTSFKVPFMAPDKEMAALKKIATALAASRKLEAVSDVEIRGMVEFALRFRKAFAAELATDNISFRELKRWVTKRTIYGGDSAALDESFVDALYTNLETLDQVQAMAHFESAFGRKLELPEEYSLSADMIADGFIKQVA